MLGQFSSNSVEEEMMMCEGVIVEEIHEEQVVIDEASRDVGVWKIVDWHGVVVDSYFWVDVELVLLYLCESPCCLSKCPQSELAVIKVGNGELVSDGVLLDLLQFNVGIFSTTNQLFHGHFVGLE